MWCAPSRRPRWARRPQPAREVQALEEELVLADLEIVERRLQKLGPGLKRKPTDAEQREYTLLTRVKGPLEEGVSLRAQEMTADETRLVRGFQFLSLKPILHCLNLAEDAVTAREKALAELEEVGKRSSTRVGWVSAAVEAEVAALPPEEQRSFLDALGLPEPALHRVIRDAYTLLGLASFFTVGEDEVRAWTIPARGGGGRGRGRDPLRHRARVHPRGGDRVVGAARVRLTGRGAEARAAPAGREGLPGPGRRGVSLPLQRRPLILLR